MNIYVGHPTCPKPRKPLSRQRTKGVFADMETRADGIYGLPVFTNEGSEIVERKNSARVQRATDQFRSRWGERTACPSIAPRKFVRWASRTIRTCPFTFLTLTTLSPKAPAELRKTKTPNHHEKLIALCCNTRHSVRQRADDANGSGARRVAPRSLRSRMNKTSSNKNC